MDETTQLDVTVRNLRPTDLEAVIALDAKVIGRRREEYFRVKLQQNLLETGIKVSLAAEVDGAFAGFLLASVYYGEFGQTDPAAVLDTIGVHPDFQGHGVGDALIDRLRTNLFALGVASLRTQVDWDDPDLLGFFHREGFQPAARLCLELAIDSPHRARADD
ncbi:MAG TPA: GNAT family N-acetyltransferase [Candidatus Krumholzibacteria bacterium]